MNFWKRAKKTIVPFVPVVVSEELDNAVMRKVIPVGHLCNKVTVELGSVNQDSVNRERERIYSIREWLKTQDDPRIIKAYQHWLNFLERGIEKAQQAIDSGARDKWQKESKERQEQYLNLKSRADALAVPSPKGVSN